ncbi:MAG TPA: nucleotidyltransferase domain-containing protein [Luteolibacter sp.]
MAGTDALSGEQRSGVFRSLAAFHPVAIYLFGSMATGSARANSDVDLAFIPAEPVDALACFHRAQELAELFGREVDLVDLTKASTVLAKEVLRTGWLLEETDRNARQEFEMRTLADYARLNEERQPVLAAMA